MFKLSMASAYFKGTYRLSGNVYRVAALSRLNLTTYYRNYHEKFQIDGTILKYLNY